MTRAPTISLASKSSTSLDKRRGPQTRRPPSAASHELLDSNHKSSSLADTARTAASGVEQQQVPAGSAAGRALLLVFDRHLVADRERRASRGFRDRRGSSATARRELGRVVVLAAHCTSERRSKPTPASEICGSPERRGKCWWRLPCIHENALLRVGRLDNERADDGSRPASGETQGWTAALPKICFAIGAVRAPLFPERGCVWPCRDARPPSTV